MPKQLSCAEHMRLSLIAREGVIMVVNTTFQGYQILERVPCEVCCRFKILK